MSNLGDTIQRIKYIKTTEIKKKFTFGVFWQLRNKIVLAQSCIPSTYETGIR